MNVDFEHNFKTSLPKLWPQSISVNPYLVWLWRPQPLDTELLCTGITRHLSYFHKFHILYQAMSAIRWPSVLPLLSNRITVRWLFTNYEFIYKCWHFIVQQTLMRQYHVFFVLRLTSHALIYITWHQGNCDVAISCNVMWPKININIYNATSPSMTHTMAKSPEMVSRQGSVAEMCVWCLQKQHLCCNT